MSCFSKPPLPQHVLPPITFKDVVDTDNGRAVLVSQLSHLALTSQISMHTPVVPLQACTRRPCCFAKTCHGCSCRHKLLALRNSKILTCVDSPFCARRNEG